MDPVAPMPFPGAGCPLERCRYARHEHAKAQAREVGGLRAKRRDRYDVAEDILARSVANMDQLWGFVGKDTSLDESARRQRFGHIWSRDILVAICRLDRKGSSDAYLRESSFHITEDIRGLIPQRSKIHRKPMLGGDSATILKGGTTWVHIGQLGMPQCFARRIRRPLLASWFARSTWRVCHISLGGYAGR